MSCFFFRTLVICNRCVSLLKTSQIRNDRGNTFACLLQSQKNTVTLQSNLFFCTGKFIQDILSAFKQNERRFCSIFITENKLERSTYCYYRRKRHRQNYTDFVAHKKEFRRSAKRDYLIFARYISPKPF